jgi:NADPH2 dehydrogenase
VYRIKEGLKFDEYKRESFYSINEASGYVDYPFSIQYLQSQNV